MRAKIKRQRVTLSLSALWPKAGILMMSSTTKTFPALLTLPGICHGAAANLHGRACGPPCKSLRRAVYLTLQPELTDRQLAEYGLRRSDYEADLETIYFDEQTAQSWQLFRAMQTQWRIGMNGPTGLDYNTLPMLFELYKIDNREAALLDLQIPEGEYLKEIYKKSNKRLLALFSYGGETWLIK